MTKHSAIKTAKTLWHTQRIKRLIRDHFGSDAACIISVRETICTDPDCPGPATEIRITTLSFREIRVTIHKPSSAVSLSDIPKVI